MHTRSSQSICGEATRARVERASDVQLKDKIDQRLGIGIDAQMQQEVASRFLDCDVVMATMVE